MSPISSRLDMNSRATQQRSHRSRIRSGLAVSNRDGVIEDAYQGKQGSIGHRLIPVIENHVERRLAPHGADDGAEDGRHPQQRGKACTEADAAKRCKKRQNEHSQAKASNHLDRSQLSRKIRKLRQDQDSDGCALRGPGTRSQASGRSKPRQGFVRGLTRNCR